MTSINKKPHHKPFTVAFIPARGGSKGVPRKNARLLGGKPLLAYSVEIACAIDLIDHVVVSTEDPELAEIARHYGAEVPFLRPPELAGDDSRLHLAIDHLHAGLKELWAFPREYITLTFFPTSPFRNLDTIRFLVQKAIDGFNVNTVKKVETAGHEYFTMGEQGALRSIMPACASGHNGYYKKNGLLQAIHWGEWHPQYYHIVDNPISLVDIDTWTDFFLAEAILQEGLFDFGLPHEEPRQALNSANAKYRP